MSILDDAIREHLELKRAHGADEVELKKLEDEAFGPPGRPDDVDPMAEAPTEFLTSPGTDAGEAAADAAEGGRRAPNIADLQEPPPAPAEPASSEEEAPVAEETPSEEAPSEQPAAEDPAADPAAEIPTGPTTEERTAIAEQPTEMFDVQAELDPAAEVPSPSDEELVASKLSEPRLEPTDSLPGLEDTGPDAEVGHMPADEDEDDDFFSEQRLSDELNQALEAPLTDEEEALFPGTDEHEPAAPITGEHEAAAPPATDEHEAEPLSEELELEPLSDELEAAAPAPPHTDEHEALAPPSEEHEIPADATVERDAIPTTEEGTAIYDVESAEDYGAEEDEEESAEHEVVPPPPAPPSQHEDVLEDTPEFLEDAPEDDNLWFEQKPPKDFDFDD